MDSHQHQRRGSSFARSRASSSAAPLSVDEGVEDMGVSTAEQDYDQEGAPDSNSLLVPGTTDYIRSG